LSASRPAWKCSTTPLAEAAPPSGGDEQATLQSSWWTRLRSTASIAISEARRGSALEWLLLGLTGIGLAFDWGPGQEWLLGFVGGSAFGSLDPTSTLQLIGYALLVGAATGAASAAAQGAVGILMAGSLRAFPETFRYWDRSRRPGTSESRVSNNRPDPVTALTLGAALAVVEKNFQQPGRSLRSDAAMVLRASLLIGGFNTAMVAMLGVCGYLLQRGGHDDLASALEAIAKNPLTYVVAFVAIKLGQTAARRTRGRRLQS
jgi:hypothetical protein